MRPNRNTRSAVCLIAALIALAAGAPPAWASYSKGGAFRLPGYGARAWAMAGAATATVDDEGAVWWNPAMLSQLRSAMAGASYVNLVPGATAQQSQLAYARVLQRSEPGAGDERGAATARHAVGALYTNLHLDVGDETYNENYLRLAYAYSPDYFVTFAVAGDLYASTSGVPDFDAVGTSVDFASRLTLTEHVTVAAVARNAFSRYSFDDGRDAKRDRSFVFGAALRSVPRTTIEGDVVFERNELGRLAVGMETDYLFDLLSLRGGYEVINTGRSRAIPHFGFGLRALRERLSVHYNANLDDEKGFEDTHRFSLSVSI